MVNTRFYGSYNDADGNDANLDFDISVFVNAHRFVHVWDDVFLGANYRAVVD